MFRVFTGLAGEYTEARILRLLSTKPARLVDLSLVKEIVLDIKKLRRHTADKSTSKVNGSGVKSGWEVNGPAEIYWTSASRIAKLDLLIEDLHERVQQLVADEKEKNETLKRSKEAAQQFAKAGQDASLAGALWHALDTAPPTVGYVYFKRWTMPDGSCWYKVGITNNRDRRETEQNVLPVAAETIVCVDVGSMDRARAIEAFIHQVLVKQRITDANNRELFHLGHQQASAVKAVLERLE